VSLATKVLIGIGAGAVCGLFFGEYIDFIGVVGQAFILLLQMTVLPYVAVSLITGLGKLTAADALSLAKCAGGFLLIFWGMTVTAVLLIPIAFPSWTTASFFSTSMVQPGKPPDFLSLFIPSNPFHALADSIVPSVVVFSIAMGVALIGIERKKALLDALGSVTEALGIITSFIVQLAPYGVFAIVAQAAGTMDPADIKGLEVYVILYAVVALVLALWAIPGMVTVLTPFRYRDVVWYTRDALVTAFATGNVFVVLAVLAGKSKELLHAQEGDAAASDTLVDVVVPTSYAFPTGKLLALSFVLFAGWLSGFEVSIAQYPGFVASGVASFFGSTMVAIPFLLDLFRIPADTFQLFIIADNVVGNRFTAMLGSMHVLALALLAASAMQGMIRVRPKLILRYVVVTVVIMVAAIGGVRVMFEAIGSEYLGYTDFIRMSPSVEGVETRILGAPPEEIPPVDRSIRTLERIHQRGFLRVGYARDSLPWAFQNESGKVVGFDIDMVSLLAREMGVSLELVLTDRADLGRLLNSGYLDTVVGGIALTTERMEIVWFSAPYMDATLGFVVLDYRREEFSSREAVKALKTPRLAVLDIPYYRDKLRAYLPQAEQIVVDSVRDFFRDEADRFDALVLTAQTGSAWCMIYPKFSVAVPLPDTMAVPFAFPVARGDQDMLAFLTSWIELKTKDGTIDGLFDHWILGEATKRREPRWSVIRDVLGWVD